MRTAATALGIAMAVFAGCGGSSSSTTGTATGGKTTTGASTGSGNGGSGGSGPLTAEKACTDLETAVCDKRDSCTGELGSQELYGSLATCIARTLPTCLASLAAPKTGVTAEHDEGCAQAYPGVSCTDFLDVKPPDACAPVAGQIDAGGACAFNAQCKSTFCHVGPSAVCGTCAPQPAVGTPCTARSDCGNDQVCSGTFPTGTGACTVPVADGGACDATRFCGASLSCVGYLAATKTPGKCQPAVSSEGAACDAARKVLPDCDHVRALGCVASKCQKVTLVGDKAPCGYGIAKVCDAGGLCVKDVPADVQGICHAPAADGKPCDSVLGPPCLLPARCVVPQGGGGTAGVCQAMTDASKCM